MEPDIVNLMSLTILGVTCSLIISIDKKGGLDRLGLAIGDASEVESDITTILYKSILVKY
jgi:hypothetical protein